MEQAPTRVPVAHLAGMILYAAVLGAVVSAVWHGIGSVIEDIMSGRYDY